VGAPPAYWDVWRRGESVTVEAVPNHPIFGTPRIRRITWRYLPDPAKLAAAMLSGAIDAVSAVGISQADLALQLERQAGGRFKVAFVPSLLFEHVDFNLDNPFFTGCSSSTGDRSRNQPDPDRAGSLPGEAAGRAHLPPAAPARSSKTPASLLGLMGFSSTPLISGCLSN